MEEESCLQGLTRSWIEFNNFCWDMVYENMFSNLVNMPFLGPNRNYNHQLMRSFNAWLALCPATLNYQVILLETQIQTLTELVQQLSILLESSESVKDWQQIQRLWGRIADDVYRKTFCLDENLKIRGNFLNAIYHYRLCQQELMDVWLGQMNLPLRSEVDEIHRSIYELRKEVKALKKARC